jgi:chorismate synthase
MTRLDLKTAGESHGPGLVALLTGLPAGLPVDLPALNADLCRRQSGHGRGDRMKIESDEAEILAGVRHGHTTGAPVALLVWNRDFAAWQADMAAHFAPGQEPTRPPLRRPRPGHADLAGAMKYDHFDLRDVLERASARETAARVAAGAVCRQLLARFGVVLRSRVLSIGSASAPSADLQSRGPLDDVWATIESSPVRTHDAEAEAAMVSAIDAARADGDTLGGVGEVIAFGVPPGLGSYASWDARLDGALSAALMSIPSVKAVEIGDGVAAAHLPGSQVHDEIVPSPARPFGVSRSSNHAGGVEGGVSNGEPIVLRIAFKPIPTLVRPLASVNLDSHQAQPAHHERSDVCVVPAGCIVAEAMAALILADALLAKFGGDHLDDTVAAFEHYLHRLGVRPHGDV